MLSAINPKHKLAQSICSNLHIILQQFDHSALFENNYRF